MFKADVDKLNCGRTGKSENDPHSQVSGTGFYEFELGR